MNCKTGDLAIVIHQSEAAPNVGRIVEVIEWAGERGTGRWPCWVVKATSPMNAFKPLTNEPTKSLEGIIPDAWLRPISGLPLDEETRDEVTA
jgi:hypothetical protein